FCSALCSTFLAGCVTIQQPANGSFGVTNPTAATVTWFPDMQVGTFVATLDNVDVSGQFSVDYPNQKAAATLNMLSSQTSHTLIATGNFSTPIGPRPAKDTSVFSTLPALFNEFQPNIGRGGRAVAVTMQAGTQVAIAAAESGGLFETKD